MRFGGGSHGCHAAHHRHRGRRHGRGASLLSRPGPRGAEGRDGDAQVEIVTPGGATLGLVTEAMMKETNPQWPQPVGQRVTFACRCDAASEVDEVYARVAAAGYAGRQAPWDAFWGQRYAMLSDADGNRVDLFAEL